MGDGCRVVGGGLGCRHTAQPQNSISFDQVYDIPGFLAKSLDNTIVHGERVARAVGAGSRSTVIH